MISFHKIAFGTCSFQDLIKVYIIKTLDFELGWFITLYVELENIPTRTLPPKKLINIYLVNDLKSRLALDVVFIHIHILPITAGFSFLKLCQPAA